MSSAREGGILKVYDVIKGYGFISRPKGKDVFVRYVDFIDQDRDTAALVGSAVFFELEETPKGLRAKKVCVGS